MSSAADITVCSIMGIKTLAFFVIIHSAVCSNEYYWKIYEPTSRIPIDAVEGGKDLNQDNVFIGQASVWGHAGMHSATISPGRDVWVVYGGARQATNFIQILCSENPQNFVWLPATSTNLHLVGIDTHIVRGGMDQDHVTYIGRVKYQGTIVIGKVYLHDINNMDIVFVSDKQEHRVKSYEILSYNTTAHDPEPRFSVNP